MFETSYNGIHYCFYDDRLTINDAVLRYESLDNIQHRSGDEPAFIFDYRGKRFAMPYPADQLAQILPYMKIASRVHPDRPPTEPPLDSSPREKKPARKIGCLVAVIVIVVLAVVGCFAFDGSGYDVDGISEKITTSPVRDDKTGSWKLCRISESADPRDYALDYYNSCFEDGDSLHWIVNFGTNTTTSILSQGGLLTVTVHERVDGEEKSADTLGAGMILSEFIVNAKTGEITDVQ